MLVLIQEFKHIDTILMPIGTLLMHAGAIFMMHCI